MSDTIKPLRIGRYLPVDDQGFISPDVHRENIQSSWRPILDLVTETLLGLDFVTGVYIRGSIPRGLAREGLSDADFLCITTHNNARIEPIQRILKEELKTRFPFLRDVEISNITPERLTRVHHYQTRPYAHMLLKTQSLFLEGVDITPGIAPFRPDREMISHVFELKKDFDQFQKWEVEEPQDILSNRQWLSRRIVRAGLELTLAHNKKFTRDLYLCWETFSSFYPAHRKTMFHVLENALNGHRDMEAFHDFIQFLHQAAHQQVLTQK